MEKNQSLLFYGVFEETLADIISSSRKSPDDIYYLQPKNNKAIKLIEDETNLPLTLFITTSHDVNTVSYVCEVVKWENKFDLDAEYIRDLSETLLTKQPSEKAGVFLSYSGDLPSRHLIHVKRMKKLNSSFSTSELIKVSDEKPCKSRSQGGGHAVVYLPKEELIAKAVEMFEISEDTLNSTTTSTLVNARLGQGTFRRNVTSTWGNGEMCALTAISTKELLIASHIKAWAKCDSSAERLDGCNGILLASHIDKLFVLDVN